MGAQTGGIAMVKKLRSIAAFGLEVADLYTGAGLSRSAAALS